MLSTILAFLIVIAIVVFVHEIGHFLAAKFNGVYVITFSFGFGPKLLKKRIGETEYAVSILPFGGYVKFAGESDSDEESNDGKEPFELSLPEERLYRSKNPFQKMVVVVAGPVMNALLALLVFIVGGWVMGTRVNPSTVVRRIESGGPAEIAGIIPGDRVISINKEEVDCWDDVYEFTEFKEEAVNRFVLLRGADTIYADLSPVVDEESGLWDIGMSSPLQPRIGDIKDNGPADRAGIKKGALVLSVNDKTVSTYNELVDIIHSRPGIPLKITWEYEGEVYSDTLIPDSREGAEEGDELKVIEVGEIGIGPCYEERPVSFFDAVRYGSARFRILFVKIIDFLKKLVTGKAPIKAIGGPLRVGALAGDMLRWGINYLVYFIAFFSLNLAIINLMPILPFDGGHFVLHFIELVIGREINERVKAIYMQIGFAIFIILIAFIVVIDMLNLFN